MLPDRILVHFANGSVCEIELLKNQLVELWYDSFTKNQSVGFYTRPYGAVLHSKLISNSFPQAIEKINNAIERVEYLTDTAWNIRAYDGMQFDVTNTIHRYFTTSMATNIRTHQLQPQLKNYITKQKQESYISHRDISNMIEIWSKDNQIYRYSDNAKPEIEHNLQIINAWIHLYEVECLFSERTRNIKPQNNVLANDLDLKRIDGSYLHNNPAEPIIRTEHIPLCHTANDANVYALKKILGKDYVTCYFDHDNPLEWDITMANTIDGSFIIDYEGIYEYLYNNSDFQYWINDHKLKDRHTYSNVQIGRVTNSWCEEFQKYAHNCSDYRPRTVRRSPLEIEKESEIVRIEPDWSITHIEEVF